MVKCTDNIQVPDDKNTVYYSGSDWFFNEPDSNFLGGLIAYHKNVIQKTENHYIYNLAIYNPSSHLSLILKNVPKFIKAKVKPCKRRDCDHKI